MIARRMLDWLRGRPEKAQTQPLAIRVERYSFAIPVELTLGEPCHFRQRDWTMKTFEPDKVMSTVQSTGFVTFTSVRVDAIELLYEQSKSDAPTWDGLGVLHVQSRMEHGASIEGDYYGEIPEGYQKGQQFRLTVCFIGPAQIAPGHVS